MKNLLIICLICMLSVDNVISNETKEELIQRNDSLVNVYTKLKSGGTGAIRLNADKAMVIIDGIIKTDSLLREKYNDIVDKQNHVIQDMQEDLDASGIISDQLKKQLDDTQMTLSVRNIVLAITIVIVILLLVVLIRFYRENRRYMVKTQTLDKQLDQYHSLITESESEMNALKTEVDALNIKFRQERDSFTTQFSKIMREKSESEDARLLIENQIIEIKKAYDIESVRRQEAQDELAMLREKIERTAMIESELKKTIEENELIKTELADTKRQLIIESDTKRMVEDSLQELLIKISRRT